ncbi:hypothetical protein [Leisingera sp. JC11]|uniref:hypothetical protein n=1 Tax=Leisingera sp. JC11 TaxID=3042469 RepID=UPI00345694BB
MGHLSREHRERLSVFRDGVRLVAIATEHQADELAAELHGEMPWMAPATEAVWHAMRRSVRDGWPGLRLPPILLDGPPGIGKSHWARRLGQMLTVPTAVVEGAKRHLSSIAVQAVTEAIDRTCQYGMRIDLRIASRLLQRAEDLERRPVWH